MQTGNYVHKTEENKLYYYSSVYPDRVLLEGKLYTEMADFFGKEGLLRRFHIKYHRKDGCLILYFTLEKEDTSTEVEWSFRFDSYMTPKEIATVWKEVIADINAKGAENFKID